MKWDPSMPLQGAVPAISSLERKDEPWSSYTEGWNDALDLAEQAAVREMSWSSPTASWWPSRACLASSSPKTKPPG